MVRSHDGALGGSVGDASYTEFSCVVRRDERARGARLLPAEDDPLVIGGDEKREFRAMSIEPDGDVIVMEQDGRPYLVGRELHAIGAAQEMAMGAMYAGASAEQAVRICVERSDAAGGEVFVERLASVESVEEAPPGEAVAWDQTERDARAAAQKANEEWRERMGLA